VRIIDSDNYSATGIETMFFPGGEPHARIPKDFGDALLFLKARTWNDFGLALCVMDAIRRQGHDVSVFAPYLPGARQDRSDGQTPITAQVYLDALWTKALHVFTFDAHSDVTADHVTKNYMPADLGLSTWRGCRIIAPDHGAIERARSFAANAVADTGILICDKVRDFATGQFKGFKMPPLPEAAYYLIVDDICDGGGTFNLLAEEFLKDPFAEKSDLILWVSHGIFSKGTSALHPKISTIVTTDSYYRPNPSVATDRTYVYLLRHIIDQIIKDYA
jgi:ribose-phosphate pyrophosphokinase